MKNWMSILAILASFTLVTSCSDKSEDTESTSEKVEVSASEVDEKFSYMIGYDTGKHIKNMPIKFDFDEFVKGLKTAHDEDPSTISEEESKSVRSQLSSRFQTHKKKQQEEQTQKQAATAQKNETEGNNFLAKNKGKKDVKVTKSGLQYIIKKQGTGAKPKQTDKVEVHYRGTLINGSEFDSSHKRNKPTTFQLNQVIQGWGEGITLMKEGAQFTFFIPPSLAYGAQGAGPKIPPNSTLIFDVELLKVVN